MPNCLLLFEDKILLLAQLYSISPNPQKHDIKPDHYFELLRYCSPSYSRYFVFQFGKTPCTKVELTFNSLF